MIHLLQMEGIGFIFTVDDLRIYFAGDTDFIPEMKNYGADVVLFPIGGTYTMNMIGAVEVADAIKPRTVIPMHYNYIEGTRADPTEFVDMVKQKNASIDMRVLG